jgi:predicted esterase
MSRCATVAMLLGLIGAVTGCDRKPKQLVPDSALAGVQRAPSTDSIDEEPPQMELPAPPFHLPVPKQLPAEHNGVDLSKIDPNDLEEMAMVAALRCDLETALATQFWAVKKGAVDSQCHLAWFYAQNKMIDEAIYWFQQAASAEGVDAYRASEDPALDLLRGDPRYSEVVRFLRRCNRYWEDRDHHRPMVVLPKGFDRSKTSPVIVNLYFLDSRPDQFCGRPAQELADNVGIPVICVSDARPIERFSGHWSQDPVANAKLMDAVLMQIADRVTIARGGIILLGFAAGARTALELASRDPDRYAGAVAVSPFADGPNIAAEPSPKLRGRRFVIATGAEPGAHLVETVQRYRDWLDRANAEVQQAKMEDQFGRRFSRSFDQQLTKWVAFILSKNESPGAPDRKK